MTPFRRSRAQLGAAGVVATVLLGVGFIPLFGGPGYEHALASGLLVPSAAAIATAIDLEERDGPGPFACVGRGLASGLFLATVAFATALIHAVRVGLCDLGGGALDFVLTAGMGALLGGVWGAVVAEVTRKRRRARRLATVLGALALPLLGVIVSIGRFYTSPMVFAFDPFFGYFSGTLYDTVIDPGAALVTYRGGTLATIASVVLAASLVVRDARGRIRVARVRDQAWGVARACFAVAFASLSVGISAYGAELGHWETSTTIAAELRGARSGARCDVIFPDSVLPDDAALLVKDCDEELAAVERELGARGPDRVRAFFFRDAAEKRRLMGAADTYIAKPWRDEVYLQLGAYPHPVLGHELAHVVAGSFGRGPFRVAGKLGGLWPNPGLIEGTAVAASPDDDELTDAQWAHAMIDLGALPSIRTVFSIDFLLAPAAKSYTLAGAFVRWVMIRFGKEAVRAWYGGASIEALTHETWADLDREFRAAAAETPLPPEAVAYARARFERPAIFGRRCPHVVDALRRKADRCREDHEAGRAIELYDGVLRRDPHDWAARYGRALVEARFGDEERGRLALRALADAGDAPRTWHDRMLDAWADAELLDGRPEVAAATYRGLATLTVEEDFGRTEEVKALAAADAEGRDAVTALLLGGPRRPSDMVLAANRLTAWEVHTNDAIAAYLLGKNLEQRGWRTDADAYLDGILARRDYVTPRIGREIIRDRAIDACAERDAATVDRMRALVLAEDGPYATSYGRKDSVLRLLARCAVR